MSSIDYQLSQLDLLEAESIHIMREVAAEFERPGLLFSGGKDSIVMLRLAEKAFWPAKIPFPLMHVDTGHNFAEVMDFRDRRVTELGARLIVASVEDAIAEGLVQDPTGPLASRNSIQTVPLLKGIIDNKFDAVFGGARRDEEKARAKERVFSFRDEFGQWDPEGTAARAVEPVQRAPPQGRAHPHLPDFELDRTRHLAVRPARRTRAPVDLLRAQTSRLLARQHADGCDRRDASRRGCRGLRDDGALPDRRRHDLHRSGRIRCRHARQDHRRRRGQPNHRTRRDQS